MNQIKVTSVSAVLSIINNTLELWKKIKYMDFATFAYITMIVVSFLFAKQAITIAYLLQTPLFALFLYLLVYKTLMSYNDYKGRIILIDDNVLVSFIKDNKECLFIISLIFLNLAFQIFFVCPAKKEYVGNIINRLNSYNSAYDLLVFFKSNLRSAIYTIVDIANIPIILFAIKYTHCALDERVFITAYNQSRHNKDYGNSVNLNYYYIMINESKKLLWLSVLVSVSMFSYTFN